MIDESLIDNLDLILNSKSGIALMERLFLSLAVNGKMSLISKEFDTAQVHKLGDICEIYQPKTISKSELIPNGEFLVYGANGVIGNYDKFNHEDSEVLVTCRGATCGTVNVSKPYSWINGNAMVVRPKHESLRKDFLTFVLKSVNYEKITTGTAQPQITRVPLANVEITVPSLAAQEKVINIIGSIFELLSKLKLEISNRDLLKDAARKSSVDAISTAQTPEEFDINWGRIQSNWEIIAGTPEAIDSMKTLILDLAVRGDLVTVDSPKVVESIEWTSSELKLDDSKIWSLPTLHKERKIGWNRIPLAKLGFWGSGGTPTSSRKDYYQNGTIPWAVIGDLNNHIMTSTEASITDKALADSSSKLVPKGAILIAMYGASIGKTAITGIECCTNQAIAHCVVDTKLVSKDYFFIVAKSLKRHLIQEGKGAAQPNISQSVLKHLIIDLPPLAEQALIVERVEALMELCDRLNFSLQESEVLAEKFSRSVVSASA
jgi:type I restriction enzyme S subunit